MPIEPHPFAYHWPMNTARTDYIKKLIAKGCSERKAQTVARRKYR